MLAALQLNMLLAPATPQPVPVSLPGVQVLGGPSFTRPRDILTIAEYLDRRRKYGFRTGELNILPRSVELVEHEEVLMVAGEPARQSSSWGWFLVVGAAAMGAGYMLGKRR